MGEHTAPQLTPAQPTPGHLSHAAPGWWRSQRHLLGVFLVAMWVAWFGVTLWSAPHEETAGDLRNAVSSGDVKAWDRSSRAPDGLLSSTGFGPGKGMGNMTGTAGTIIEWQDASGQRYWADGADLVQPLEPQSAPQTNGDAGRVLDQWMVQQGAPDRRLDIPSVPRWLGVGFWAFGIAAIVFGYQPRRGNRWFWFWLSSLTLGLGVLAYAVFECIRDPKQAARPHGGVTGLVWVFAGKLAISLAVLLIGAIAVRM
ncbi:hypothetical protein [Flexivirga meconopsidis]|uniref:hypothetical protein n=1 Tax=Flexivirga meconopsidis TaxID=2977121 RepID=UPI00223FD925|nr:hypothetical protein [Flexivirga meconopsidis]